MKLLGFGTQQFNSTYKSQQHSYRMERNNIQPNTNYNTAFTPNTAPAASQQQQAGPVPALGNAADLSAHPSAKNLQNYSAVAGEPDTFNLPEYQPIKPGEPYLEKLANEAMNTKKLNMYLKNAQENEELEDFKDAEESYEKALKYTEAAEHYKLYGECLRAIYLNLSQIPLNPSKDEAKEKVYKEKAAKAFYYLGGLYEKQGASKEAYAAYKISHELACHEVPLQALVAVARQVGETGDIVGALDKLADFYAGKGDTALAIKMLEEAVQVEKSFKILQKLEVVCGQAGGKDSQLKVNETRIQQFELQISEDPKNISIYRKYAWFLKDIGMQDEARAVKERMDTVLQQNIQTLEQKVIKQKTKIGGLKEQVATLEKQVFSLDFSQQTDIQDADLIALLKKNTYIKFLNLQGCGHITDEGLKALEGLTQLRSLNLRGCNQLTGAGLQHLAGLTQLTSLNLVRCTQLTDAVLQHLAGFTQLTSLNLSGCSQLTGAGLRHLAGLTQLTTLTLVGCIQLTDAVLQYLSGLTQLTSLNFSYCIQLTDAGLQHLAGLTQLTSLELYCCDKLTDAGLQHLAGLTQLTTLDLRGCNQLTDAVLQYLSGLTQLTSLNFSYCIQLTDAGLQHLAGLTQLTTLTLGGCSQLTDAGLQHLAGLTQLTGLNLSGCSQLTDAGLKHLAGLTQLTSLNLEICNKLTDAGLQHLAGFTQLTDLNLSGCKQLTDASLQHIAGLTQITSLNLSGCIQLTDANLQHLAGLTQLTSLNLSSSWNNASQLTDAGLQHLKGLTQLTFLNLDGCAQISRNAKEQLKKQIPGLEIKG